MIKIERSRDPVDSLMESKLKNDPHLQVSEITR